MKKLIQTVFCTCVLSALALPAFAQSTAFTYQGRLEDGGSPANGNYDLRLALFNAVTAGTQQGGLLTNAPTPVSNGLFTVTLDFGNQFPGADRWLELAVRTNGGGAFSTLAPRQAITATPYAVQAATAATASSVAAANISGIISSNNIGAGSITTTMLATGAVGANQLAAGAVTTTALANGAVTASKISGVLLASQIPNLDASEITTGTLSDARLSANVARRAGGNTFSGSQSVTNGNVGIGTASPVADLHVNGPIVIQQGAFVVPGSTSSSNMLNLMVGGGSNPVATNGSLNGISFYEAPGAMAMSLGYDGSGAASQNALRIYNSSGNSLFTFEASGQMGIGTNNPSAKLHIGGVPGTDGIKFPDGSVQTQAANVIRYTTSSAWPIQSLAGGAATSYGFSVSGVQVGSAVIVTAMSDLGPGIVVGPARVSSTGNVSFYVQNISNAAIDPPDTYFTIAVFP